MIRLRSSLAVLGCLAAPAFANGDLLGDWQSLYPESSSDAADCQLCHRDAGGGNGWNAYGWAVREGIKAPKISTDAIADIENIDGDLDPTGSWNLTEILRGTQPGWTPGPVNTVYFVNGSTLTNQLPPPIASALDPVSSGVPPAIDIDPVALDFGVSQSGDAESFEQSVSITNLGQQSLNLGTIEACDGTSAEFMTDPSGGNELALGKRINVNVTYTPTGPGLDVGCFTVPSNDPDQSAVELSVAAHRCASISHSVDAEIDQLLVPVSGQVGGPSLGLSVQLASSCSVPSGNAVGLRLVGEIDLFAVYDESVSVDFLALAGGQSVVFPSYRPTRKGQLQWTVTLTDDDPDVDTAMAVTEVSPSVGLFCIPVPLTGGGVVPVCF